MRIRKSLLFILLLFEISAGKISAQDTFSIVAVDSNTQEVASAGASCVDLSLLPGFATDFLGDLIPGKGAINTQSFYDGTNQANARKRILAGDTPQQALQWLVANDAAGDPTVRQYGIAALVNGNGLTAAFTGGACFDFKGHRVGRSQGMHYAIQGNILITDAILDSMEARFIRANGDLACRVMAAMQGANVPGADERCSIEGVSSKFAFLKMSRPTDRDGFPTLSLGIQFKAGESIEPLDTLQRLFERAWSCQTTSTVNTVRSKPVVILFPNPANEQVVLQADGSLTKSVPFTMMDQWGRITMRATFIGPRMELPVAHLPEGMYQLLWHTEHGLQTQRVMLLH